MAELKRPAPGQIGWIDLTVPEAQALCAFYQHVTGWTPSPVAMGGYSDYCMIAAGASTSRASATRAEKTRPCRLSG